MNHQPFEEWLLSDEEITPQQKTALDQHLDTCPECPRLARAWQEVHAEIRRAPLATPAPGFSARFADRLEKEHTRKQHRITWLVLAFFLIAGLGAGLYLLIQNASSFPSPVEAVSNVLITLDETAETGTVIVNLLSKLPAPLTLGLWIALASSLLFWTLIWCLLIWRLPNRKGVLNETNA